MCVWLQGSPFRGIHAPLRPMGEKHCLRNQLRIPQGLSTGFYTPAGSLDTLRPVLHSIKLCRAQGHAAALPVDDRQQGGSPLVQVTSGGGEPWASQSKGHFITSQQP